MPFDVSVVALPYYEALELDTTQNVQIEQNNGTYVIARVVDTALYHFDELPRILTFLFFGYSPEDFRKLLYKKFPHYKEKQYEKQLLFFIYMERVSL